MSFGMNAYTGQPNSQVLSTLVSFALLAPGISVAARRFHDVGLSGWLVAGLVAAYFIGGFLVGLGGASGDTATVGLAAIIVIAAAIAQLVVALIPSRPGPNAYGPNPKGV